MKATLTDLDYTTIADRRERVRASVTQWTDRVAAGAYVPSAGELAAVAALCTEYFLPVELARVRRWMTP